jgi:hypothetical protein
MAFNPSLHPRAAKGVPGGGRFITANSDQSHAAVKGAKRKLGGRLSTERIRAFQRQHGLKVDGVIGRQTAAALLGNPNAKGIPVGRMTDKQHAALRKFGKLKPNEVQPASGSRSSSKSSSSSISRSTSGRSQPKKSTSKTTNINRESINKAYGLKSQPKKSTSTRHKATSNALALSMSSRISSDLGRDKRRAK